MNVNFAGRLIIFGSGAVSRCLQSILLQQTGIDYTRIIIVEPDTHAAIPLKKAGAQIFAMKITQDNYIQFLNTHAQPGDVIIDLSVDVDTGDVIEWCQEHAVGFINTSIEWWDPLEDSLIQNILDRTLYVRHEAMRKRAQRWKADGSTAIVEHGANPGLVSHWTKQALEAIALHMLADNQTAQKKELESVMQDRNFARIAQLTGTKVIHISERDTQITTQPKQVDEFVNTWSVFGLCEEAMSPAELTWGTHEKKIPDDALFASDLRTQMCLDALGMNTLMYSWIPSGEIIGALIRHGEAVSIGKHLTVMEDSVRPPKTNSNVVYAPTVHYVYLPSDSTWASLHELRMSSYSIQPKIRILYDDIADGEDEVGVLLLGHGLKGWWEGSRLSIHQTRDLVGPGNNATTLQVAASVFAAFVWLINNPNKGLRYPDDLPYKEILQVANPYLGECLSVKTDWNPYQNRIDPLHHGANPSKDRKVPWQFEDFVFSIRRK